MQNITTSHWPFLLCLGTPAMPLPQYVKHASPTVIIGNHRCILNWYTKPECVNLQDLYTLLFYTPLSFYSFMPQVWSPVYVIGHLNVTQGCISTKVKSVSTFSQPVAFSPELPVAGTVEAKMNMLLCLQDEWLVHSWFKAVYFLFLKPWWKPTWIVLSGCECVGYCYQCREGPDTLVKEKFQIVSA